MMMMGVLLSPRCSIARATTTSKLKSICLKVILDEVSLASVGMRWILPSIIRGKEISKVRASRKSYIQLILLLTDRNAMARVVDDDFTGGLLLKALRNMVDHLFFSYVERSKPRGIRASLKALASLVGLSSLAICL